MREEPAEDTSGNPVLRWVYVSEPGTPYTYRVPVYERLPDNRPVGSMAIVGEHAYLRFSDEWRRG